jgi:hypothetical protein
VQVAALNSAHAAMLSTAQVAALSGAAFGALDAEDVAALKTAAVALLKTAQIAALGTAQVAALTTAQAAQLSGAQLAALGTSALAGLEGQDVAVLATASLRALGTAQIRALSTLQVASLNSAQICALTSTQVQALSAEQVAALSGMYTPLVLDLDGNGVSTLGLSAGVRFDMLAAGAPVATGWAGPADGLLALDRNGDGRIGDGGELFGSGTTLASGAKAGNGYQALAELDSNGDGAISAADAAFSRLRVWVDSNSDGVSAAAELHTLDELHITRIGLQNQQEVSLNNGNIVGLTSSYQTADGASHAAADVWFAGSAPKPGAADLRSSVSGLVQALSSYAHAAPPAAGGSLGLGNGGAGGIDLGACVAQMADSLQRFGLAAPGGAAALAGPADVPRPPFWHGAAQPGWLAAVK